MYIISKTIKGKEFMYSTQHSVLCKNEVEAEKLAEFMNNNNNSAIGDFKLEKDELWRVYEIDKYDTPPRYELVGVKGKISIREYDIDKWFTI